MGEFKGPAFTKKRGGLGRSSQVNEDKILGLVCGGIATAEYATLGTPVKITQLTDAEDLGFNAAYDTTNKVIVWNALRRIFTYDPDAIVYLMIVAQTVTMAQMCDKANNHVYKLVTDETTERLIKWVGVIRNPAVGYVPVYATGYDTDVIAAIPKAQETIVDLNDRAIFLKGIFIEGRMDPAAVISTLYNFRGQTADSVSVISCQDPVVASLDALFANTAAVGDALGMRSVRKVSESLGSVQISNLPDSKKGQETYPLTDFANGFWSSAQLASGKKFSDLTVTDQNTLETKGVIYAGKFEGLNGFFFNDGHTCIIASDDYAYQEDNAVWTKAASLARKALLPVMKGEVDIDPATGFLPPSQIAYYQAKAAKGVSVMTKAGEISGDPIIRIAPDQDVVGTGLVTMDIGYVRKGVLRNLTGAIGAINPAVNS